MKSICPISFKTLMHLSMPDFCLLWHGVQPRFHCSNALSATEDLIVIFWSESTWRKMLCRCINHRKFGWSGRGKKVLSAIHHREHTYHFCFLSVYWFFFWRCAALFLKQIAKRYSILKHLDRFIFLAQYVYSASPDMLLRLEPRTDSLSRNIYLVLFHVIHWQSIKTTSWA